jgi:hypothetical protein
MVNKTISTLLTFLAASVIGVALTLTAYLPTIAR